MERQVGRLQSIWRYPVKGLPGQRLERVLATSGRPLPHDRRFALCNGNIDFDGGRPHWMRRVNFLQVASNAPMVMVAAEHRPDEAGIRLHRNGEEIFAGDLRNSADARRLEKVLAELVGPEDLRGPPRLVEIANDSDPGAEGQAFADTPQPHVSIINLATVRAIGESVGAELDERRFRGNLYIEAEPWSEFDWVGRTVSVGDVRLAVRRRIGRCAATNVNPRTGERDQTLPLALRKNFGHADCGVYAVVEADGDLRAGAPITLVNGA